MYEYTTVVESKEFLFQFKDLVNMPYGDEALESNITKYVNEILSVFPQKHNKLLNEGWDLISHSLFPLENRLVVSLLLRRVRP